MSYYSYDNRGGGGFLANVPTAVKNIIIINALVMVMTALNKTFMYETFALFYPTSPFFHWWQPVTHMFMHGGFWHLFFNMYTLWIFGSVLERVWGTKKFLLFYFVTGLGAALVHTGVEWLQMHNWLAEAAGGSYAAQLSIHTLKMTPTVGASGAIYGLLGAMLLLTKKKGSRYTGMSYSTMLLLAATAICLGFFEPNVDNLGHIGGFLGGMAMFTLFLHRKSG